MPQFSGNWQLDTIRRYSSGLYVWGIFAIANHYNQPPQHVDMYRQQAAQTTSVPPDATDVEQTNNGPAPADGEPIEGHDPARRA